jgi:hypothetical protein
MYSFECKHGADGGAGVSSPQMEIRGENEQEDDEKRGKKNKRPPASSPTSVTV